ARNESLRVLRRAQRAAPPVDDDFVDTLGPPLDADMLAEERAGALRRAFAHLSERCQNLLRLLASDPEPSYEDVSAALGIPVGSIGPTRGRCLDQLRRNRDISRIGTLPVDSS